VTLGVGIFFLAACHGATADDISGQTTVEVADFEASLPAGFRSAPRSAYLGMNPYYAVQTKGYENLVTTYAARTDRRYFSRYIRWRVAEGYVYAMGASSDQVTSVYQHPEVLQTTGPIAAYIYDFAINPVDLPNPDQVKAFGTWLVRQTTTD
jgi:hypothetical protein